MITELSPDLDQSINRQFGTVADDARVQRTAAALEANGISVLRAADAADAKRIVLGLIPDGSQVHHGASLSLEESGITEAIETVRSLRAPPPAPLEHGPRDPGRRDPPPELVTGRDARQRARGHRDRIAGDGLGEWQPARAVRQRRRPRHPRRGDAEDRRPTSRRRSAASTTTSSRSRMPAPRRRMACTAA